MIFALFGHSIGSKLASIHWWAVGLVMAVGCAGLLMLYSAAGGSMTPWASAQGLRFAVGAVAMLIIAVIPIQFWLKYAYVFYGIAVLMLVVVEVIGHIGMGAQRWVAVGGVTIQPSELAKIAVILALARYFHRMPPLKHPGLLHLVPPILMVALPAALILKQPNLGTTTVVIAVSGWIAFAAGVRLRYFITVLIVVLAALPIAWELMHDYQRQRVMTFLNPEADPLGAGYNITQSMIAIGSGGMFGKGFLNGSQGQLDFLPEKQTDFIFTMLTEEFGFLGGMLVVVSYSALIIYAIAVSTRCRHLFGTLVANGVAAVLCLHFTINVAMVMGLIPVVGIPLPLLSYGGSVMITVLLGFGLLFNVWVHRDEKLRGATG
ncbi:MAG: rod shape-determining protein RodA [Rickettsiales bacterium]|nr:rod shape-determining protein RodA [Rickettsiales bacterium]